MKWLGRIFVLLLAANLLLALWFYLRADVYPAVSLNSHAQVDTVQKSELTIVLADDMPPTLIDEVGIEPAAMGCYLIGEFNSEDAALALLTEYELPYQIMVQQAPSSEPPRYRVRSQIADNREAGLEMLAELREMISQTGVSIDSYLVTTGPIANSVSLGLFSEQTNALNVQRILVNLGAEIVVEPEIQLENRYQLLVGSVYPIETNSEIIDREGLNVQLLEPLENLCEMIAQLK